MDMKTSLSSTETARENEKTETGFTPGPWDVTGCSFPDDGQGGIYYRVQAEEIVASAANARLIAAAPELYEALFWIVGNSDLTSEINTRARRAIGRIRSSN